MAIKNQAELEAQIASLFADNTSGDISPADIRMQFQDHLDSLQSYAGVISDGNNPSISITSTPTLWTNYTQNNTGPNAVLEADYASGHIHVKEPALYFVTIRLNAEWAATENLVLEVYINGAPAALTPISFSKEGKGTNDPELISVTDEAILVNTAMIAAGPGGTHAEVGLYISSSSGTFTLDQLDCTFGVEYNPLSIRTVG